VFLRDVAGGDRAVRHHSADRGDAGHVALSSGARRGRDHGGALAPVDGRSPLGLFTLVATMYLASAFFWPLRRSR
jgi:hypothetical protein